MIFNIVDRRKNNKKFKSVWGVVEPTQSDNSCTDADKVVPYNDVDGFIEFSVEMSFSDLLLWAGAYKGINTLYVYDKDPSICVEYEEK